MKLLLSFVLTFLLTNTYGQLTQGQVYNYEVGDVVQASYYHGGYPVVCHYDSVVEKEDFGATILYTFERRTILDGPGSIYPQYSNQTFTKLITVNATAAHYSPMSSCLPFNYSYFQNSCGNNVWHKSSAANETCFEPPYWSSILIEGVGGPFYFGEDPTNPGWHIESNLVYSNTAYGGTCGTPYVWWSQPENEEESEPEKTIVKVYDALGRETDLANNCLLFVLYDDGSMEKKVIIE